MPTYQYACTECPHTLEQFQSFSDDALVECPACEGRLRKVFNAVGVVFKGSGFYRNDSRSAATSKNPTATTEGGSSSTPEKSTPEKSSPEKSTKSESSSPASDTKPAKPAAAPAAASSRD